MPARRNHLIKIWHALLLFFLFFSTLGGILKLLLSPCCRPNGLLPHQLPGDCRGFSLMTSLIGCFSLMSAMASPPMPVQTALL